MTYHRLLAAFASCLLVAGASPADAQSASLAPLKSMSTLAADADKTIAAAVQANLQKLDAQDPAQQSAARDALVADADGTSAAYKDRYSAAVAAQYVEQNVAAKEPRARLNAAVALARIAGKTNSAKLQPAVLALIDPKQPEAVQLWALKAAGAILADSMKADPQRKLLTSIVPSIKDRLTTPMTDDAYNALNVPVAGANSAVVDEILRLTQARLAMYQANQIPVEEASIDANGLSHILTNYWTNPAVVTKPQQVQTMQLVCHLVATAAQLGDQAGAGTPEREQFQGLINRVVASVYVAASTTQQTGLAQVAQNVLGQIKPQQAVLATQVQPLCPAIRQVPGFQAIKDPAPVGAGNPAGNPQ